MKPGIIICSRLSSSRIPKKAMRLVNGIPLLGHLILRLIPTGLKIVIAVPVEELPEYREEFGILGPNVFFFAGYEKDPLARMNAAAHAMDIDTVIRINHDKVFVQPHDIRRCLDIFSHSTLDYIYSSSFVPGSGFEVIRADALEEASNRYENVEHVSYAIHTVTDRKTDVPMGNAASPHRLLVDYPEDIFVLERVMEACGNDCNLDKAISWLDKNPDVSSINRQPQLTVYTCGYNADAWINECMQSVADQVGFKDIEYILIDDSSQDFTGDLMEKFAMDYRNVHCYRNESNVGLASSSNLALARARGKYILRLDADDYFTHPNVLLDMIWGMGRGGIYYDAVYPDYFLGSLDKVEKGHVFHHAGGAMFATKALNYLKFTDGLRGYDSYDLYERAKTQLKVGYLHMPTFFYRQHHLSLSKSCPVERQKIKEEIDGRIKEGN